MSGSDTDTPMVGPPLGSGTMNSDIPGVADSAPQAATASQSRSRQLDMLVNALQQLAFNQQEIQGVMHQLGQYQVSQAASASAAIPVVTKPSGTLRVREPRVFDGRAIELMPFLDELASAMHLQRQHFQTDYDRSIYLSLYLKAPGAPSSWFHAIQIQRPDLLHDFEALKADFKKHFDDPDLKASKQRELERLVQKGSAAEYSARFHEILVYLNMTDETKIHHFKRGLKADLLTVLMSSYDVPTTLTEFASLAIKVDNRLFQAKAELNKRTGRSTKASLTPFAFDFDTNTAQSTYAQTVSDPVTTTSTSTDTSGIVPMEIDAVKRGPLSPQERSRRKQLGLCMYCGATGHTVSTCPLNKKKGSGSRAIASSSSKKGKGKPGSR